MKKTRVLTDHKYIDLQRINVGTDHDYIDPKRINVVTDHDYIDPKSIRCSSNRLRTINNHLKNKLKVTQTMVKQLNHKLRLQRSSKYEKQFIKNYLRKNDFTQTEINRIMNRKAKKRQVYSRMDFVQGLMLYSQSRKCYRYLRSINLCSLPSPASLTKWVGKLKCTTGIQYHILSFLQEKTRVFERESDRNVSLCFDEIDIKSAFSYDSRNKRVLKPSRHVNIVMRSLQQLKVKDSKFAAL